jgi:hypothetical protein
MPKVTKPMGRPPLTTAQLAKRHGDRLPENWQENFLNALRLKPNISAACKKAQVSRSMISKKQREDAEFNFLVLDAMDEGRDRIEEAMVDRALAGDVRAGQYLMDKHRYGEAARASKPKEKKVTVGWKRK